jgi:hypothetical protein
LSCESKIKHKKTKDSAGCNEKHSGIENYNLIHINQFLNKEAILIDFIIYKNYSAGQ